MRDKGAVERMRWDAIVRDDSNRIIRRISQPGHSFLTQFYLYEVGFALSPYGSEGTTYAITDTSNTARTMPGTGNAGSGLGHAGYFGSTAAGAGTNTYGIQVGTGSTANSSATYALASLIANGSGAGQLNYGASAASAATSTLVYSRTVTNNSGGSITINEAGVTILYFCYGDTGRSFLIIRDVLGTPIVLGNGNNTTLSCTRSFTFS